jgi:tRNA (cytidine/uridine-2'-O-)-methyltransferase
VRIVLVSPLIPQNTGSIGRLCAATDTELVLVEPLGFKLEDRMLKRAGLDYWPWIKLRVLPDWDAVLALGGRPWLFTAKATTSYTTVQYAPDDLLVFGSETTGLPPAVLQAHRESWLRIPIVNPHVRSLNLAQCAAVALFEARRQVGAAT